MAISSSTFISDVVLFIRDLLRDNLTDPLSRDGGIGFCMTAFPKRDTKYPVITIKNTNITTIKLGMQSEVKWTELNLEINIFARNAKELDELTQNTINLLRNNQYGSGSTNVEEIHGFNVNSVTPIMEEVNDLTIHQNVLSINYKVILQ